MLVGCCSGTESERLVSGSDDFTLFMWNPSEGKKPIIRLTGHQQVSMDKWIYVFYARTQWMGIHVYVYYKRTRLSIYLVSVLLDM